MNTQMTIFIPFARHQESLVKNMRLVTGVGWEGQVMAWWRPAIFSCLPHVHAHTPTQKRRNNHYTMLTGLLKHEANTTSPTSPVYLCLPSPPLPPPLPSPQGNTTADLSTFSFFSICVSSLHIRLSICQVYIFPLLQYHISISLKKVLKAKVIMVFKCVFIISCTCLHIYASDPYS